MGHAKSPQAYIDIERILDTALRHDSWPVTFSTGSEKAATRWVARANSFRVVLRELEEERLDLPKGEGTCKYDGLTFTRREGLVIIKPIQSEILMIGDEPIAPLSDREIAQEYDAND